MCHERVSLTLSSIPPSQVVSLIRSMGVLPLIMLLQNIFLSIIAVGSSIPITSLLNSCPLDHANVGRVLAQLRVDFRSLQQRIAEHRSTEVRVGAPCVSILKQFAN